MIHKKQVFKVLSILLLAVTTLNAAPKKILVVTTTSGYRHSSIATGEKIMEQLAKQTGEFTVDFIHQPDGKPANLPKDATKEQKNEWNATNKKWTDTQLKPALLKLSYESLKGYDAVVFINTTGDLPLPDMPAFLNWIKEGNAFIGVHAASDTFHKFPDFVEMLGGEFRGHGPQISVECLNQDPEHPSTAHFGKSWLIKQEEIYLFKSYDTKKVHDLLILDKSPDPKTLGQAGHFPISWCKQYGKGNVFYTSLGHREDIWDGDEKIKDRKNDTATSKAFQQHLLGGIEWALGLKK